MLKRSIQLLCAVILVSLTTLTAMSNSRSLVAGLNARQGFYAGATICRNRVAIAWCSVSNVERNDKKRFAATWTNSELVAMQISFIHNDLRSRWASEEFQTTFYKDKAAVPYNNPVEWRIVTFPSWLLIAIFSLPFCRLIYTNRRRSRWRREGLCGSCAYDLRGITSEKCPECGRAFQRQTIR